MAGVNFEKIKTAQSLKAQLRHCDTEMRKATQNHANKHINKAATVNNRQLKRDYAATCKMYDKRIKELDSIDGQNRRKDRVTCFGLEIPFPKDLQAKDEMRWCNDVVNMMFGRFGKENVLNAYIHRDEQHEYVDANTGKKRMSRNHMHVYVIPVDENDKLNGKEFSSKKSMISLNNAIQKMSQDSYGVDFMDGTRRKSKESVESLKARSEQKAYEEKMKELECREKDLQVREDALKAQETVLNQLRIDLQDERDKASKTLQEALEEKKRYKQASERLERQEMENKQSIACGRRHMAEESYERIHGEPTGRIRGESGRIFGG